MPTGLRWSCEPDSALEGEWIEVRPTHSAPKFLGDSFAGELFIRAASTKPEDEYTCACEHPHVLSDDVFPYFEGMFTDEELDRNEAVNRRLTEWLKKVTSQGGETLLYPIWQDNSNDRQTHGSVDLTLDGLNLRELFFVEGYLYRFKREPESGAAKEEPREERRP